MAIKVALAAALLVALLALAGATTFTTTVTTSLDDELNPQGQCSRVLRWRRFRACQRYLSERRGPFEDILGRGREAEPVEECCRKLRQVDEQGCGCEAIRLAVRQVQQSGPFKPSGPSEQMYEKAQELPRICRLRSQQCQIRAD